MCLSLLNFWCKNYARVKIGRVFFYMQDSFLDIARNNCELSKLQHNYIHRSDPAAAGHYKVIEKCRCKRIAVLAMDETFKRRPNSLSLSVFLRLSLFRRFASAWNCADGLPESSVSMTNGNRFNPLRSGISAYPSANLFWSNLGK